MINCIVIPLICNRYIKGKIYVVDGLTDNIFMLSLTTALVPPILLLFDPYALFIRFKVWLKSRPCNFVLIQPANYIRAKSSIILFTREYNLKLDMSISILSTCLCLFAIMCLFSRLLPCLHFSDYSLCIGYKNIVYSIDIKDLFQELTLSIKQFIRLFILDQ